MSTTSEQNEPLRPTPSTQDISTAAAAVAAALDGKIQYALVGGAACAVLGSPRVPEALEIVVPKGRTAEARTLLKQLPGSFDVEPRTLHTYFKSGQVRVRVELLAPPGMFRDGYDEMTPVVLVRDSKIRVLKPTVLLNVKCRTVQEQRTEEGRRAEAMDIVFLLGWCQRNGARPTGDEVPRATMAFVHTFISLLPSSKEHWVNAGYDLVRFCCSFRA